MVSSVIVPSSEDSCPSGFNLTTDSDSYEFCRDIDECSEGIAQCSHFCRNSIGSYFCDCPEGYEMGKLAKICEGKLKMKIYSKQTCYGMINYIAFSDIDECTAGTNPCGHREKCVNTPGSFVCKFSCGVGFRRTETGTSCEGIDRENLINNTIDTIF